MALSSFFSWRRPRDPVDEQLADIARQGSAMSRLAHACAFLLIVLFSLGSLVALSGDALTHIAAGGITPATIPDLISATVSTLLVACMDVAMVYAAAMLRILLARRAARAEMRWHVAVLICASVLEAGTYVYMAWEYDRPATLAAWILVAARALAAPLFSVYLSMARPLPVGPRDILYQVELASGKGVIRDAVTVANDTSAPLERKMALYGASAVMTDGDRARLDAMIEVVQAPQMPPTAPLVTIADATVDASAGDIPPDPTPPPNGRPDDAQTDAPGEAEAGSTHYAPSLRLMTGRAANGRRASGMMSRKAARNEALRTQAFALLDKTPDMTRAELRDALRVRRETASALYAQWAHLMRQRAAR